MRRVVHTSQFKRDFKKLRFNDEDESLFIRIVDALIAGIPLEGRYRDHVLTGNWVGCRECHLKPDLLLIYNVDAHLVKLVRIGSHSSLFK